MTVDDDADAVGPPVACVTGAGSGIGRAVVHHLAAAGWRVLASDRDLDAALATLAGALPAGDIVAEECDVSDPASIHALAQSLAQRWGRLDALVVNAAIYPRIALRDTTVDDAARVLSVNVLGAIGCALSFRSLMASTGRSSLVFVTSGSGDTATARHRLQRGFALYGASKAALDRWVIGVCDELADDGIAAHLICPGAVVRTDGIRGLLQEDEIAGREIDVRSVAEAIGELCRRGPEVGYGDRFLATEHGATWGG